MNNLKNHIDAPIRKAVAGMNLLGFKTYMSCCGFSYKDEEVIKSHLGKAYIYLDYDQIFNNYRLSNLLTKISLQSNWQYKKQNPFIDFYGDTWSDNHPWKDSKSVHRYEIFLLVIRSLNETISIYKNEFVESTRIIDGNSFYKDKISKYWQYEPVESWEIKKEEWDTLES